MATIIARSHFGARDLFHGILDLREAIVVNVFMDQTRADYSTVIVLKGKDGEEHKIIIRQAY